MRFFSRRKQPDPGRKILKNMFQAMDSLDLEDNGAYHETSGPGAPPPGNSFLSFVKSMKN